MGSVGFVIGGLFMIAISHSLGDLLQGLFVTGFFGCMALVYLFYDRLYQRRLLRDSQRKRDDQVSHGFLHFLYCAFMDGYDPQRRRPNESQVAPPGPPVSNAALATPPTVSSPAAVVSSVPNTPARIQVGVDVNRASASQLSVLPGIDLARAEKAVSRRQHAGAFRTVEEFYEAAGVPEELRSFIRPLLIAPERGPIPNGDQRKPGRVIDV